MSCVSSSWPPGLLAVDLPWKKDFARNTGSQSASLPTAGAQWARIILISKMSEQAEKGDVAYLASKRQNCPAV